MLSYCTPYLLPGAHKKKECPTTDGRDGFVRQKGQPGSLGPPGLAGVRVPGPLAPRESEALLDHKINRRSDIYHVGENNYPQYKGPSAQSQPSSRSTRLEVNQAKSQPGQNQQGPKPTQYDPTYCACQVKIPYSN